jgi:hypothetical protein
LKLPKLTRELGTTHRQHHCHRRHCVRCRHNCHHRLHLLLLLLLLLLLVMLPWRQRRKRRLFSCLNGHGCLPEILKKEIGQHFFGGAHQPYLPPFRLTLKRVLKTNLMCP